MPGKVNRDCFYRLASDLQDERVKAAVSLIEELSALELPACNEEWSYVLKRLISGLASGRNSARLGFSLCLSEVVKMALDKGTLAPQDLSSPDQYLELLSNNLSPDAVGKSKKDLKGKDERGILFGKMFGLQAILNEPLFTSIFFDQEGKVSPFALRFAQELAELAVKKNWLRESCLYTLFQTVQRLVPAMESEIVSSILLLLDKYQLTMTNEGLAIYLLLFHGKARKNGKSFKVPSSLALEFAAWKNNDPLSKGNLPQLSRVLRDAPANDSEVADGSHPKSANWNPRLHFVWDILIPILAPGKSDEEIPSKKSHKKKKKDTVEGIEFPEFFQAAVDETFFSEKASSERKYLGFLVFIRAVEVVSSQWIQSCFTQNFMRTLINQSSDSKRLLNKISQKALDAIVKACEKDASEKIALCLEAMLFGPHGTISFDKLTKSKTASKLVAIKDISSSGLDRLFNMLSAQLSREEEPNKQHYQFVLDTVLHAVRTHRLEISQELIAHPLLDSIVTLAFFSKKGEDISDLARERLFSILSELTIQKDGQSWQHYTLKLILSKEAEGNEPINKLDEDLKAIETEALDILQNISSDSPQSRGLEWLLSNCLLQLYSGDSESLSIVEELCIFYREGLNESNSLVGITEILLSLLAQKKALLRKLSLVVWEQFVSEVGEQELKILLEVLDARENKEGFAKLFENVDDYQEESAGEEEDLEDGEGKSKKSDDKSKSGNDPSDESEDASSASEEDSSDDSDAEDDSNVAKIDREATSALAKALNLPENIVNDKGEVDVERLEAENGANSDEMDDDDDDEEDEEEDEEEESMDDEQMMKLDEQLSQIFKRRKEALSGVTTGNERKVEVKEARENVITFKHRIVDMLEAYIKHADRIALQDNNDEANSKDTFKNLFLFVEPMIRCLQLTLDKPLADKISKLLKGRLYKIKISAFKGAIDSKRLLEQLEVTHKALLTSKPGQFPALYFSTCSTTSLFLGKVLVENNSEDPAISYGQMIDLYADTTKEWLLIGKFGANVFADFHNWLLSRKKTPNA
ncbi:ZYRO0F00440p [Zygosaccharomyces rouxii]|uniref:ZYRO0F00440p n=1 Tax=Zygosaccharomyces rouxii (strain ATCC 2623 / CBS 732 / NBRC 1130 / NCYC 568 / NRRL Y-229) TaxID=559307 RepID=C5DWX7_ZYGRC|nr:uncharacterized protein ZYRO0F00440g [Zygosaccharomyces rouxii]KAH9199053.1 DNA polymerase V [Zygosaccharomyces rouxii]CAR28288.1 ZYRO0F00440p [Zygosaccharomyces rouxii]